MKTHRVGVVAELPGVLLRLGVEPHKVLAASGVPPSMLRNPENRIPFDMLGRLMEEAAAASQCPHVAVLLGLAGGLHSLGLIGRLMVTAPTLRHAIFDLCVNQVRYINGAVSYLTIQDGVACWGYSVQTPPLRGLGVIADGAIGVGCALLRDLCGLRAEEVRLGHAAPSDAAGFRTALGVPVIFNADQSCLVLPARALDTPVRTANRALREILRRQVATYWARSEPSIAEQTRRVLAAHLTAGKPGRDLIAQALGIGPRTLNRRLQAEGTSFRAVLDEARYDVARQLLGTTWMPVTEIGMALGYTAPASFVRAFRRSAGMPPSEWRRMQAGGRAA